MIDFDVETTGFQPYSGKQTAFMYIFSDGETTEAIRKDEVEWEPGPVTLPGRPPDESARDRIQAWFDHAIRTRQKIRCWNTKFDRSWADAEGFRIPGDGFWHDGMIDAQAIDERRSVALKAVGVQLFGEDADDLQKRVKAELTKLRAQRKRESEENGTELVEPNYSDVSPDLMREYGMEDVLLTRKVCNVQDALLADSPDLQRVSDFEHRAMDALYAIEKRGIPASADDYRMLELEANENADRLYSEIMALAAEANPNLYAKALGDEGVVVEDESGAGKVISYPKGASRLAEFNPGSTPQIIACLKARKADLSHMSEKNGKLSADAENLRAVDDPLAEAILNWRAEQKVITTYVRPMLGRHYDTSMRMWREPYIAPDGRIHATYRQVGARTGRMSCSDPNMQNQPRDDLRLRYCIRAEEGMKLVACDLSNIEMVLFAAFAGEGRLLNTIREGGDLHALTAKMLGIRDRVRPGGVVESARQLGKTYNFSRVYGGGLRTIRRQFRCDMNEARLYKKRFDDAYPEVERLVNKIQYRIEDQGYVQDKIISGRRFRVSRDEAYKGANYLIQGTAAALLKYAVIQLHADGVPMVALVHDEIVAHVPANNAEEVKHLIIQRMTEHEAFKERNIPLRAEGDVIDRWSQAKDPDFVPNWAREAA